MGIVIALNRSVIYTILGQGAAYALSINDKQITDAGVNFTDAEFLNISKDERNKLNSLLAKGFINVISDGKAITNLDSMESFVGDAIPEVNTNKLNLNSLFGSNLKMNFYEEEVTIAVGAGLAGVATSANLVPDASTLMCAFVHVIQAPGGGATTLDVGRTAVAVDELADGIAVALDTKTNSWLHAVPVVFEFNAVADTLTLTTDANVTVSDMIVRVSCLVAEVSN